MSKKRVCLLILNYNGKVFLKNCLNSFLKQTYKNFKLVVIDNHSSDGSLDFLKRFYPKIQLVANDHNLGIGKAFNKIIKKNLRGFDYIGLFNADIKLDKNWLKETVKTLNNSEKVQVCNGLVLNWQGKKVENAGGKIINLLAGIFGGFLADVDFKKIPSQFTNKEFSIFFGLVSAMLVRSSVFKKIGLFDESYFIYLEDVDFCWRVILAGGKIVCNPKAKVYHYGHGSNPNQTLSFNLFKFVETNILKTYYKNLSFALFITILPVLLISRILGSFLYFYISPKITIYKLKGLFDFFIIWLFGSLKKTKLVVDQIRKISDLQVLSNNPTSLFSSQPVFLIIFDWLKGIKKRFLLFNQI